MRSKQAEPNSSENTSALSDEQIASRKKWLLIDDETEKRVKALDTVLEKSVEELMDTMYEHFNAFEHSRAFFPSPEIMERAKKAQTNYFLRLTKGDYDRDYVNDRLRVGRTHYRTGLDTKWYMGAYCLVLSELSERICEAHRDDPEEASRNLTALRRIMFFDMGLAIDTYNEEKELAIRENRDAIRELETESRVTRTILENAPLGIVRVTCDLTIVECNQEFAGLTGSSSPDALKTINLFDIAPGLNRVIFEQVLSDGVPYQATGELCYLGSPPEIRFFDWAVWPTQDSDGAITGLLAIFSNVSDMIKLLQQREDFVATLTHDLKTPILAANRALKLLRDGDFGDIQDTQKELIETILQSNDAMYQMVLTLLDVYKYDSGDKKLQLSPTDLVDKLKRMLNELTPLAEARRIELVLTAPQNSELVICDWDELRRVVQNLVDNSLKFTSAGGRIVIQIEQDSESTTVSVIDNGKGIRDEDKPKLFQRFWQASSGGRYYASTGLGLYLCH
ncbi:MAG: PAS domain-containing protein, partial [Cyanobacteria bacterium HKST-UBA02]|nr:PAS domain-containing protein [Cyanobacteria bacterium HKST-UBA02]